MSKVVDTSVFKRKKPAQPADNVADQILEGQGPEGAWGAPEVSKPVPASAPEPLEVDDDPMVQMTIRCPQSVRERFEAMARGTSRKDKKTYGVLLEILMDEYEAQ